MIIKQLSALLKPLSSFFKENKSPSPVVDSNTPLPITNPVSEENMEPLLISSSSLDTPSTSPINDPWDFDDIPTFETLIETDVTTMIEHFLSPSRNQVKEIYEYIKNNNIQAEEITPDKTQQSTQQYFYHDNKAYALNETHMEDINTIIINIGSTYAFEHALKRRPVTLHGLKTLMPKALSSCTNNIVTSLPLNLHHP